LLEQSNPYFFSYIWAIPFSKLIQTDFLIIGQGIAGTLLSHELIGLGKRVIVIDNLKKNKSSLVAGAVLNPMAGKHWSPSPQAHTFLPKAIQVYQQIEAQLNISVLKKTVLKVFHETAERKILFEEQRIKFPEYFKIPENESDGFFDVSFGCGIIKGLHQIDAQVLLEQWKIYLERIGAFIESEFDWNDLQLLNNSVRYQNIEANKVIFCTGASAMSQPFFKQLPFTKNRGEALIVSIPNLPTDAIYHKNLRLIPKSDGLFWCGSNYTWNFEDLHPDIAWRDKAGKDLEQWLKVPFEIKDHIVASRPTTAGQVPFIGIHPEHRHIAIFNGLGTRGFSSGPYWAHELANVLLDSEYKMENYSQHWFDKWFQ
jgi:glycine/D-amino acid oxidase-like deaminating enzyme